MKPSLAPYLESHGLSEFLAGVENKILETGLLSGFVRSDCWAINLSLGAGSWGDDVLLKINLDFDLDDLDEAETLKDSLTPEVCDDIQDLVIDYVYEKGFADLMFEAASGQPEQEVNWVHISVNGQFLYD